MARSPWNQWRNRKALFSKREPVRSVGRRRRWRPLDLESLEQRTLLAVLPSLGPDGVLSIAFTASNDVATVSEPNSSTIRVFDGTTNYDFPLASVLSIAAAGNDSSNQSVTFTGGVVLPGPLSATGVTSEILNGS